MGPKAAVAALYALAQAIPHRLAPGETAEERDARVHQIVEENYEAAAPYASGKGWTRFGLAAAVTVLEGNESGGFDRRVHAGEKHPVWSQDNGLAHCLAQLHETIATGPVPHDVWVRLAGLDVESTALCAKVATAVLVSYAKQCGVFLGHRETRWAVARAFAGYHYGGKCVPEDMEERRAAQWEKLVFEHGPRPDVPGFRRVAEGGVPGGVRRFAEEAIAALAPGDAPGVVLEVTADHDVEPRRWKVRLERHAGGKVGFSAFEREERQ